MILPALNLLAEILDSGNVVGQALAGQDAQFDLGNVEPARMDGGCNGSLIDQPAHAPVREETLRRTRQACGY